MSKLEEKFKNIVPSHFGGLDPELIKVCVEITEQECIGFAEWASDNQFTKFNDIWTSTKIHYSGCGYTTKELYELFQLYQKSKENEI